MGSQRVLRGVTLAFSRVLRGFRRKFRAFQRVFSGLRWPYRDIFWDFGGVSGALQGGPTVFQGVVEGICRSFRGFAKFQRFLEDLERILEALQGCFWGYLRGNSCVTTAGWTRFQGTFGDILRSSGGISGGFVGVSGGLAFFWRHFRKFQRALEAFFLFLNHLT